MFALPKAALPLFRSVAGACVLPTAKRLLTLMVGAILATGRRTITNLLRAVGGLAPGHPSSYHRVFSRRRWSLWPLAHGLADLILRHWSPAPHLPFRSPRENRTSFLTWSLYVWPRRSPDKSWKPT